MYARRKLRVRSERIGLELRRNILTARRCGSMDIFIPLLPVSVAATLQPYIGGLSRFLLSPRMGFCNRKPCWKRAEPRQKMGTGSWKSIEGRWSKSAEICSNSQFLKSKVFFGELSIYASDQKYNETQSPNWVWHVIKIRLVQSSNFAGSRFDWPHTTVDM